MGKRMNGRGLERLCREWRFRYGGKGVLCVRSGFTLVELMAVIFITAIIAALMLSALSKAKSKAQSAKCISNLHQLGIALGIYLDDYSGTFPYTESIPADNTRGISWWFDALGLELPNAKWGDSVFNCPAYHGVFYEGEAKFNNLGQLTTVFSPCGSYAFNVVGRRNTAVGPSGLVAPGLGYCVQNGQPYPQPVRESDVRVPADLYVLGDAPLATARWGIVAERRLGGAPSYNAFASENSTIGSVQHAEVFNMLFADAHVESVRTKVLLSTNALCRRRWNRDNLP